MSVTMSRVIYLIRQAHTGTGLNHNQHREDSRELLEKNAGVWTGRVDISREEIPSRKLTMYGYILTYSRLYRENPFLRPQLPTAGLFVWTPCSPSLEDLGQANVDVPLGVNCLPVPERGRGQGTGFGEEDCNHLIGSASRYREFHRRALTREKSD